ncbi:MAG: hypothetical protein KDD60_12845, partial [Bdellovibrionales bacterium]|nr:hypothetical protein [Bdellovibrionales bacterium]
MARSENQARMLGGANVPENAVWGELQLWGLHKEDLLSSADEFRNRIKACNENQRQVIELCHEIQAIGVQRVHLALLSFVEAHEVKTLLDVVPALLKIVPGGKRALGPQVNVKPATLIKMAKGEFVSLELYEALFRTVGFSMPPALKAEWYFKASSAVKDSNPGSSPIGRALEVHILSHARTRNEFLTEHGFPPTFGRTMKRLTKGETCRKDTVGDIVNRFCENEDPLLHCYLEQVMNLGSISLALRAWISSVPEERTGEVLGTILEWSQRNEGARVGSSQNSPTTLFERTLERVDRIAAMRMGEFSDQWDNKFIKVMRLLPGVEKEDL